MSDTFITGFNYLTDFITINFKPLKPDFFLKKSINRSQSEEGFTEESSAFRFPSKVMVLLNSEFLFNTSKRFEEWILKVFF